MRSVQVNRVPLPILIALGLAAGCDDPPLGACLEAPPAEDVKVHPCLSEAVPGCLAVKVDPDRPSAKAPPGAEGGGQKPKPEPPVNACLEVSPCLSELAPPKPHPGKKCLSRIPREEREDGGGGIMSADDRDAVIERLVESEVLPPDVARRLRRDKVT